MKKIATILGLLLTSSAVFASDCKEEALEIAQVNLDSKAVAYGHGESYIIADSLKQVSKNYETGVSVFSMVGSIYKADYSIEVGVDSSCSVVTLKIEE